MSGNALTTQRDNTGAWLPGSSGNPAGRPKDRIDVTAMCRRLTPRAVHVLDALMDDADGRLRLAAAMAILDRAHGKPVQAITSPDEATSLTFLHLVAMRAFSDELHAGRTIDAAVADDTNTVSRETNGTKPPRNLMEPATE